MRLPKIVVARLRGGLLPEHPDPDLLTAFAERTLLGKEREQVLGHLAACADCRRIVALAAPEVAPESMPLPAAGSTSWLRIPVLRWGAVAVSIGIVAAAVLIHKSGQWPPNQQTEVALQKTTIPPAPAGPVSAPTKQLARSQAPAKAKPGKATTASVPQEVASAKLGPSTPAPGSPGFAGANAARDMPKSANETLQVEAEAAAPAPATGAQVNQNLARSTVAAAKAAPVFSARPTRETAASTIGGAAAFTDLRPPSWRLSGDGLPERSFAAGQWEKVQVDHQRAFRTLASQGMEVWVGGSAGLLYHSEDMGLNWIRVIPVSGNTTLTGDIIQIEFFDHLHGQVSTASAQTWVTSDAGKTWKIQ